MTNIPTRSIAQLPVVTSVGSNDTTVIQQNGITKSATIGNIINSASFASLTEALAGTVSTKIMSPLRTAQVMVSVKAYGATGDGSTDDTTAIQSAISAASFYPIYFPAGTYRVTSTLTQGTSTDNIHIYGAGEFVSTIKRDTNGDVFELTGVSFWVFNDISIQHATGLTSGYGVSLKSGSSSCEFINVYVVNNPGGGITSDGSSGSQQSEHKFISCLFLDNGRNGAGKQLNLTWTNDFTIFECDFGRQGTMTGYPSHGVYFDNASAGLYMGCSHWDNTVAFEATGASNYNRISNNRWEESQNENVIYGGTGAHNQITNNIAHTGGKAAKDTYVNVSLTSTGSNNLLDDLTTFSWDTALYRNTYALSIGASVTGWSFGGLKLTGWLTAPFNNLAAVGVNTWLDAIYLDVPADSIPAGTTNYMTTVGLKAGIADSLYVIPRDGYFVEAAVFSTGAPGAAQTFNYIGILNGATTAMNFSSSGAASFGASWGGQISASRSSGFSLQVNTTGGATVANHRGYVIFVPMKS